MVSFIFSTCETPLSDSIFFVEDEPKTPSIGTPKNIIHENSEKINKSTCCSKSDETRNKEIKRQTSLNHLNYEFVACFSGLFCLNENIENCEKKLYLYCVKEIFGEIKDGNNNRLLHFVLLKQEIYIAELKKNDQSMKKQSDISKFFRFFKGSLFSKAKKLKKKKLSINFIGYFDFDLNKIITTFEFKDKNLEKSIDGCYSQELNIELFNNIDMEAVIQVEFRKSSIFDMEDLKKLKACFYYFRSFRMLNKDSITENKSRLSCKRKKKDKFIFLGNEAMNIFENIKDLVSYDSYSYINEDEKKSILSEIEEEKRGNFKFFDQEG